MGNSLKVFTDFILRSELEVDMKTGLVLEGGGFRGIYSAGILDCFLENNIILPYVIGVSMGACNAVNYISQQKGRNLKVPYTYINDKRYISYRRLLRKGELFGMNFIFNRIPEQLIPFDFDTFYKSKQEFEIVTTNCNDGRPFYISDFNKFDLMDSLKASTSLPLVQKMILLDNRELLDGGISDSIPVERAFEKNCDKVIVILTQPENYRKNAVSGDKVIKTFYRKYPELIKAILHRHVLYNDTLDKIKKLEKSGKVYVIRPEKRIPIGRVEKNKTKLKQAFDLGYTQCKNILPEIEKFLKL